MKLIIVSGFSGSGKSIALNVLEDQGYYCIDNLPIGLLSALVDQILKYESQYEDFAIGIDARNLASDLQDFEEMLAELRKKGLNCEVIFLEAEESILIKRFSETRRRHPLTTEERSLSEAIRKERLLLEPIISCADLVLDTSHTNVHQLYDLLTRRVCNTVERSLSLLFISFGYKHSIPADADFIFDVRCIPNPYWESKLRTLTGRDAKVIGFLEKYPDADKMYYDIRQFLEDWMPKFEMANRSYMTVAIGCTGGRHRSVYFAEKLGSYFSSRRNNVLIRHRELS